MALPFPSADTIKRREAAARQAATRRRCDRAAHWSESYTLGIVAGTRRRMAWAFRFRRWFDRRSKFTLHFAKQTAQSGFLREQPLYGPHRVCNCRGSTVEAPRDVGR